MSRIQIADLPQDNMFQELTHEDLQFIQGAIWQAVAIAVGGYIIANWPDIKKGISDGFAGC